MNYKTHLTGGILAGLFVVCKTPQIDLINSGIFVGSTVIGSLLPDIDHKNSFIGQKAKGVSKAINKLAGHRKLFHAPLFYLLLYSVCIGYTDNLMIIKIINGLFIGVGSHLILDSLTKGGLPWFYPFSKKKYSFMKIKTNSKGEDVVKGILTTVNIAIILDLLKITSIFTFTQ